jgi:hypothetical protein
VFVNSAETPYNSGMCATSRRGDDSVSALLLDSSPRVIRELLDNRDLREEDVIVIASRRTVPADILERIAKDTRWSESYPLLLALAGNPKTPLSISLSIVRRIRLFDIARLATEPSLPLAFRRKVEAIIVERIPTMPSGYRKSLAKISGGDVLFTLLRHGDAETIADCLANPRLREGHLYKFISRKDCKTEAIQAIAEHRSWSLRPLVRYALVRNARLQLAFASRFLETMTLNYLRELYADRSLPVGVRPLVHRELLKRGADPGAPVEEHVYEIDEEDEKKLEDVLGSLE